MAGVSSHTPTIIMRLTSLSIRNQAVSTRDMRSAVVVMPDFLAWRKSGEIDREQARR